ncbi:hypothetical protein FJZ23_02140 [Candidatus Parcubacteria bacterium]|nr:hypothetical protein [Candidatus Parcubacteria bacterium]
MPVISIKNWPSHQSALPDGFSIDALASAIMQDAALCRRIGHTVREVVLAAGVPGITSKDLITVSFDVGRVLPDDTTLVIEVTKLYDRPERTRKLLSRLASDIKAAVRGLKLSGVRKTEVFIEPFDEQRNVCV